MASEILLEMSTCSYVNMGYLNITISYSNVYHILFKYNWYDIEMYIRCQYVLYKYN